MGGFRPFVGSPTDGRVGWTAVVVGIAYLGRFAANTVIWCGPARQADAPSLSGSTNSAAFTQ